jgi:glucose-1-phosphate adenylyltransferase
MAALLPATAFPGFTVLAFVLAGGAGSRLRPLTTVRAKPAVPFRERLRLIDFTFSNVRNSGLHEVHVLTQYLSDSVSTHLRENWRTPASGLRIHTYDGALFEGGAYHGTADAIRRHLDLVAELRPDVVLVLSADHVYRMDYRPFLNAHLVSGAGATIAALRVPTAAASAFGVLQTSRTGRIKRFLEKPSEPPTLAADPSSALVSMGIYAFNPGVLRRTLRCCDGMQPHDFGYEVFPSMAATGALHAYDFAQHDPLVDKSGAYWRDIGTLEQYFSATQDSLTVTPPVPIDDARWPVGGTFAHSVTPSADGQNAIAARVRYSGAQVDHCVLTNDVNVGDGAQLSECVVLRGASIGPGACLKRVIVERGVDVPAGISAGFDVNSDRRRFWMDQSGVTVLCKNHFCS